MTEVIRGTPRPSLLSRNLVGLKVVVVDDDESSLDYFAVALGTCGAEVMTASTAAEALRLVQAGCPDVVLSDIAMVGRDGYWLVREIRGLADQAARLLPVVGTTADGRAQSRARTPAAGFRERPPNPRGPQRPRPNLSRKSGRK